MRGGRLVFTALGFELRPGDALLLRGPNGSGKSTLLRLLAGFLRPSEGHLRWGGEATDAGAPEHRARLHFIGHADPVKPLLTVAEKSWLRRCRGRRRRRPARCGLSSL